MLGYRLFQYKLMKNEGQPLKFYKIFFLLLLLLKSAVRSAPQSQNLIYCIEGVINDRDLGTVLYLNFCHLSSYFAGKGAYIYSQIFYLLVNLLERHFYLLLNLLLR